MIKNKNDLKEYLLMDKQMLGISDKFPPLIGKEVWKFQIALRHYEYNLNCSNFIMRRVRKLIWKMIYHHYSLMLGFDIPPNTCGKGLNIHHRGLIVVHENARLGECCNIQQGVNIGQNYSPDNVPIIGNNVYIGPGAKLFGKIRIADGCAIGAGTVVTKSFLNPNKVIVGNPAKEKGDRKPGLL